MRTWTDETTGCKMCEPDCADEWLFDIWAIGCDYDGESTVDGLKKLVDSLVEMSQKARDCLHDDKLFRRLADIHIHIQQLFAIGIS